jgi:signal transduction histidine kinase
VFQNVGRRLAILNALVVVLIIVVVGLVTFFALRQSLDREMDRTMQQTATPAVDSWSKRLPKTPNAPVKEHHDDDHRDDAIVQSGDTILFVVNRDGQVVDNPRSVLYDGLPDTSGVNQALKGTTDTRSVTIGDLGAIRVMTLPVTHDGQVIGAVQVVRSLAEHDAELSLVRWMTVLGAGLGVIIAVPAGLFLSRRAMRPINTAFEHQRMFVADASHELRTPLTLIRANAELAQMDPTATIGAVMPELHGILDEVDRTDRLVDDLLMLARADAGRLELLRGPQDLARVVAAAVESMQPLAATQDVRLAFSPAGACLALADGERLKQVVRILVDNALKHTPPGGTVDVGISCAGNEATVTVRDTGSGISAEDLPRVFDRFCRVDKARSRAMGGTGLGLAIAKAIVEAHGGRIAITSREGEGTLVTLVVPGEPEIQAIAEQAPSPGD